MSRAVRVGLILGDAELLALRGLFGGILVMVALMLLLRARWHPAPVLAIGALTGVAYLIH